MNKVPKPVRDVILELEKGLKEFYGERYRGLLLYGSYARGTAWEGSDVDLLLLLEGPVNTGREIMRLQAVKSPISLKADLAISVIPVCLEDFERGKSIFLRVVRREAVPAAA
jgi:predicted nucleotidyltransferase